MHLTLDQTRGGGLRPPAYVKLRQTAAGGNNASANKGDRDMPDNRWTIIAALLLGLGAFVLAWFRAVRACGRRPEHVVALPIALISYGQAVVLGLLQGVTELFPISSLGHSVILPAAARLEHPPERHVLPHVPRRHPSGDGARAARASSGVTGCASCAASAARCATARSAPTTPTRGSAGCSWSARSRPACSACRSSTRCARCSPRRSSAAVFLILNGVMLLRRRAPARPPPRPGDDAGDADVRIAKDRAGARRSASAPRRRSR